MTENTSYTKIVDDAIAEQRKFYDDYQEILVGEYEAAEMALAEEAYDDWLAEQARYEVEAELANERALYGDDRRGYYDEAWDDFQGWF